MVLGIPDVSVWLGYLLMIFVTVVSIVYGIVMWNKGDTDQAEESRKKKWAEEEIALEEQVDGGVS